MFGQCCDMQALEQIATQHGLHIIEDNAQAQGSVFNGKRAGSWGVVSATSFYPAKNLGALGEGGAVTTNDALLADKVRLLRNYGSATKYINEVKGHNMRMHELQASFLRVKLRYLDRWNAQRGVLAAQYIERLASVGDLMLPVTARGATHVYHLFVVRTSRRDALKEYLLSQGIGVGVHYPVPPHLQPAYSGELGDRSSFPIATELANTNLSLPLWPGMTTVQVQEVCMAVCSFFSMERTLARPLSPTKLTTLTASPTSQPPAEAGPTLGRLDLVSLVSVVHLQSFADQRGTLTVIHPGPDANTPGPHAKQYNRTVLLQFADVGVVRGEHAHANLTELLCAVVGTVEVETSDGRGGKRRWCLDDPRVGLHIGPMNWVRLWATSIPASVILLSDEPHDKRKV